MTTANKEATPATPVATATKVATKRIGYAIQLYIVYNAIDKVTKKIVQEADSYWVQGASKSATKIAAKLAQAKQLALPDTVKCYIATGIFPVTNH